MLFNSYVFLLAFLPLTLVVVRLLARRPSTAPAAFLLAMSLVFYGWSSTWLHIALLVASILVNFGLGSALCAAGAPSTRRAIAVVGISGNLALLGYFKYADFFLGQLGLLEHPLRLALPLGISFYTFTQIAYLVDTWREGRSETSLLHYALFVTWFPHLIAGPILHHRETIPQFVTGLRKPVPSDTLIVGFSIFIIGLAKKLLLADTLAPIADGLFLAARSVTLTFTEAWIGTLAYTLQLYFDFSAYSDMAIGLSLMLGVRLPVNFDSPYKAKSIIDFWRTWHMSLSRFLRDYVYIALGGNRHGSAARYMNLMLTMLIGGLWHGAGWTFVIWGGLHGGFLIVNHVWRTAGIRMPDVLARLLTFLAVAVAWVFFRAEDLGAAQGVLASMASLNGLSVGPGLETLLGGLAPFVRFDGYMVNNIVAGPRSALLILGGLVIVWLAPNVNDLFRRYPITLPAARTEGSRVEWRPTVAWSIYLGLLLALCVSRLGGDSPFLYFRF